MKLDKITNNKVIKEGKLNPNDEFYTPKYAITPLLKYLKENSKIWCPFDTKESWFVKILLQEGHTVIFSHIVNGNDFFDVNINKLKGFDYIISNPPYSIKFEVFEKLFKIGIPFAMLVGVVGLFESQKRYFNKRVAYFRDYIEQKPSKSPPFSSVYITQNILPNRIVFEEIDKKNI